MYDDLPSKTCICNICKRKDNILFSVIFKDGIFFKYKLNTLCDLPAPVGFKQYLKIRDLLSQIPSYVRIAYQLPFKNTVDDHAVRMDIALPLYRSLRRLKRLMGNQDQPVGIGDQRIARNPRLLLIRTGESPVDDHDLAAALDRALSVLTLDRHMSVDDMGVF